MYRIHKRTENKKSPFSTGLTPNHYIFPVRLRLTYGSMAHLGELVWSGKVNQFI